MASPVEDTPQGLMQMLEVANGMKLDDQSVADALQPEAWRKLRGRSNTSNRANLGSAVP